MSFPWIKNTKGEPSASLTMAVISFLTVTLWLIIWLILKPFNVSLPDFDAATAMAYLSPILGLYWGRRHTDSKTDTTSTTDEGE